MISDTALLFIGFGEVQTPATTAKVTFAKNIMFEIKIKNLLYCTVYCILLKQPYQVLLKQNNSLM